MIRRPRSFHPVVLLTLSWVVLVGVLGSVAAPDSEEGRSVFNKTVPETQAELRQIENTVRHLARRLVPCTVGLQVGPRSGSGVVVSRTGYVLTASHVIGRPGQDVEIRFPDGRVASGKTLGINLEADGGLVKISDPGEYPYAPLISADEYPHQGDWCIAVGHPNGFQIRRTPPLRIGRVIDVSKDILRTDCAIRSGDSGGPLFDMQGRVIGIHSRISADSTVNLHGPVLAMVETWDSLKAGEVYPPRLPSQFLARFDADANGEIEPREVRSRLLRKVYTELAKAYDFDPQRPQLVDQLKNKLGWSAEILVDANRVRFPGYRPDRNEGRLKARHFVQGDEVRRVFEPATTGLEQSIVAIHCRGKQVALGTIVDASGLVLTKASELDGPIRCQMTTGEMISAERVRNWSSHDLAILKLQLGKQQVQPVTWKEDTEQVVGNWVVSPDPQGDVLTVGIVSVAARSVGYPVLGVTIGTSRDEARVTSVMENSGADRAGVRTDDVVTHLMNRRIRNLFELREAISEYQAGDSVDVRLQRSGNELRLRVRLGFAYEIFGGDDDGFRGRDSLDGPVSRRSEGFPKAFQHDSELAPDECGGPLLDLAGNVIGVNIARGDRTMSLAIPSTVIRQLLVEWRSAADNLGS